MVSDLCREFNSVGECTACFGGFDLVDGTCVESPDNTAPPSDLGCARFDSAGVCVECSFRFVFDS